MLISVNTPISTLSLPEATLNIHLTRKESSSWFPPLPAILMNRCQQRPLPVRISWDTYSETGNISLQPESKRYLFDTRQATGRSLIALEDPVRFQRKPVLRTPVAMRAEIRHPHRKLQSGVKL